jgi:hypothetical protein
MRRLGVIGFQRLGRVAFIQGCMNGGTPGDRRVPTKAP